MSKLELVVHQDNVGRLLRQLATRALQREMLTYDRIGFHEPLNRQRRDRIHAREREVRYVVAAVERLILTHRRDGIEADQAGQAANHAGRRAQPAHPERIEEPDHDQHRHHCRDRDQHDGDEPRENREQEGDGIGINDHHVEEIGRGPDHLVFEFRNHDEQHDHHQRQRRRQAGPTQKREPEEIENPPGQQECALVLRRKLGGQHDAQRRHVDEGDHAHPYDIAPDIGAGCASASPTARQK